MRIIFSFALFWVVNPSLEWFWRVLKEVIIFPTEEFTELMFPIISSTAAEAWVTLAAWDSIILSRESIFELISFTAPAVSSTASTWFRIWPFTLSIFAMISVIEAVASCVLSCKPLSTTTRFSFDFWRLRTIPCSFSTNELKPFTTSPISSLLASGIRCERSAFPLAIVPTEAFTALRGFTR